jgi:hypothetical protein
VTVQSAGGNVDVGACYCDALTMDSSGGRITVANMNCQGQGRVISLSSGGGDVSIGGLDGDATICSEGGNQTLQVGHRGVLCHGADTLESNLAKCGIVCAWRLCDAVRGLSLVCTTVDSGARFLLISHMAWLEWGCCYYMLNLARDSWKLLRGALQLRACLQVTEKARVVCSTSSGGHIQAYLPPMLRCSVEAKGEVSVRREGFHEDFEVLDRDISSGALVVKQLMRCCTKASALGRTHAARLSFDSGRGKLELAARTWKSSVEHRMRAAPLPV